MTIKEYEGNKMCQNPRVIQCSNRKSRKIAVLTHWDHSHVTSF
jgi:hypothetical protein